MLEDTECKKRIRTLVGYSLFEKLTELELQELKDCCDRLDPSGRLYEDLSDPARTKAGLKIMDESGSKASMAAAWEKILAEIRERNPEKPKSE